jgi:hypothetical protein
VNPFGLFLGALGGLLFGNKLARQNLDPAEYTAMRVKYLTKAYKLSMGTFAAISLILAIVLPGGGHVAGLVAVLFFVYLGWVVGPKRIVRQEARRMGREQQRVQQKAERLARGEFRPDDPEYWRR